MKKYLVEITLGIPNDRYTITELVMTLTHKEKQVIFNTVQLINLLIEFESKQPYFVNIDFIEEVD